MSKGASQATGLSPSGSSRKGVSPVPASIPCAGALRVWWIPQLGLGATFGNYILDSREAASCPKNEAKFGLMTVPASSAVSSLQRLREACGNDPTTLAGIVECDETYVGGREANRHEHKRKGLGRGSIGKTPVLAARERGGRVRAKVVQEATARTVYSFIRHAVDTGAELHTDEAAVYRPLNGLYYRQRSINHGLGEYVRDNVTTNGVESVFAVLKRGLIGTYHHVSAKHLSRYVGEFAFRLNDGDVSRHTLQRLASMFDAAIGRRLTYKELIA
jgi:hypothetical protein